MKTMRYRIRVIALVLVCALLALILWTAKAAWFPDGGEPDKPAESVSALPPDPWAAPVPSPSEQASAPLEETASPAVETPSSEPLFDTFGL